MEGVNNHKGHKVPVAVFRNLPIRCYFVRLESPLPQP